MPVTIMRQMAWLWLLILVIVCGLAGYRYLQGDAHTNTDVTALLPTQQNSELTTRANAQLTSSFSDHFLLLVESPNLDRSISQLSAALEQSPSIAKVTWRTQDVLKANPVSLLGPSRYRLEPPSLVKHIRQGDTTELRDNTLAQLTMSTALDQHPLHDPFGLLAHFVSTLAPKNISSEHGYMTVTDHRKTYGLVMGQLSGSPYTRTIQSPLINTLQAFSAAHPETRLIRSGLVFHAAASAEKISIQTSIIGTIELISLVLLLLVVFRSLTTLISLLIPLVVALLFGYSATVLLFGSLNIMTFAFGTSLIGIAVDYAIHLQTLRAVEGCSFKLTTLLPGLTLGLCAALLGYAAEALTPLPGLRQMALFVMLGLCAAWLTTVLWLPRLPLPSAKGVNSASAMAWKTYQALSGKLPHSGLAGIGIVLAGLALFYTSTNDNLRQLNTSPPDVLKQETQVQSLIAHDMGTRYLLIEADNVEEWLQKSETISHTLTALQQQQHLGGFSSLNQHVPSHRQQDVNLQQIKQLYQQELPSIYAALGLPPETLVRAEQTLHNVPYLELDDWLQNPLGQADQRLWLGRIHANSPRVAGMIALRGQLDATAEQRIHALEKTLSGVHYENRIASISDTLSHLRIEITRWVILAFAAVTLLLVWRYRSRCWQVIAPPAGALLAVLGIYALLGISINIFHLLSLLMVLGLGIDAGIFNAEHPHSRPVWLATSLSAITNLLAFGLLVFCSVPILRDIGLTTLIGLLTLWLIIPLVHSRNSSAPSGTE